MKWGRAWSVPLLLAGLLTGVLSGCTGTVQNIPPILLAVSRINGATANPEMVLVEDAYNASPTSGTASTPPSVVQGSAVALPYPAVASDTVDRAGARASMDVLTRDLGGGTSPDSALVTLSLSGIDPSSPATAFHVTKTIQLTGSASSNPAFTGSAGPWCFSAITASLSGRYVYLLDDPNACLSSPIPNPNVRLFQLDTTTNAVSQILPSSGVLSILPARPFDDQASTSETLYFLASGVQQAQLYSTPVPFTDPTELTTTATMSGLDQLALQGTGSSIVSVTNPSPYGAPVQNNPTSYLQTVDLPPSGFGSEVTTVSGARAFAADPTGSTQQVVVAGYQQIAVHAAPSDKAPVDTQSSPLLNGIAATIDFQNGYAYVLGNGALIRLDLLTVQASPSPQSSNWYAYFPLAGDLTQGLDAGGRYVGTLSWTRAKSQIP